MDFQSASIDTSQSSRNPRAEYQRQWYLENRDRRLVQARLNHEKNKEKQAIQNREWAINHPESRRATQRRRHAKHRGARNYAWREYYRKNKAAILAQKSVYNKRRYTKNKDMLLAKTREWLLKNKRRNSDQQKVYRQKNLQKRLENCREWYRKNRYKPEFILKRRRSDILAQQKRRALKSGAAINLQAIKQWMDKVKNKRAAKCYHCQNRIPTTEIHFDHIVALSAGGEHSIRNLCVSCPSCNLKKGAKPLRLWVKTGQQILEL